MKPDTERQIVSYMESKIMKHIEGESRMMLSRGELEEGRRGNSGKFHSRKMHEFWRSNTIQHGDNS